MFGPDLDSAQLLQALYEALCMVSIALFLGVVIGILLGVLLVTTRKQGIWSNVVIHRALNPLVNILRPLPLTILLIAIVPLTKLVAGISIGAIAAIVPLTVYVALHIARLIENSLLEIDEGIAGTVKAIGASPLQITKYFLIPEALGSLVLAITTVTTGLIGSTAMAGAVGGGGIGDLALVYGHQRLDTTAVIITVIALVVVVQVVQTLGNVLARFIRRH